jgi:hypothetical protein
MAKGTKIVVDGHDISVSDKGYISLTDIANAFSPEGNIIESWLRKKDTVEFLGVWEMSNNLTGFNSLEFEGIRNEAGTNRFTLSVKKWVKTTNAVGIESRTGRYGSGTYAHKDIATDFCTHISPIFRYWLIKEFDRLKALENSTQNLEWSIKRVMSKANYHIHTAAVKEYRVPLETGIPKEKEGIVYADEAEILNFAVFGFTAKQWKAENPELVLKGHNLRDFASINQLLVLTNMESMNAVMLASGMEKGDRMAELRTIAQKQLSAINTLDFQKSYTRTVDGGFQNMVDPPTNKSLPPLSDFNNKLNTALNYNPKDKRK